MHDNNFTTRPPFILRILIAGFEKSIAQARIDMADPDPIQASWAKARLELHERWLEETREELDGYSPCPR
jgi:hypothetical protein